MPSKQEYIRNLNWRLQELKISILEIQKKIQDLFNEVELKQDQAKFLIMLLKAEGVDIQDPDLASLTNISISDIVFDLLDKDDSKSPMHYIELTKSILSKGILIPGKNPSSNLLAHINRDERFVRTASGTYGLRKWGLKEITVRKHKSTKRKG